MIDTLHVRGQIQAELVRKRDAVVELVARIRSVRASPHNRARICIFARKTDLTLPRWVSCEKFHKHAGGRAHPSFVSHRRAGEKSHAELG